MDITGGVGHRHHLCTKLFRLLAGVERDVAGAGNDHAAPVEALLRALQHLLREIAQAVAGRLGSLQTAAVAQALTGQRAGEFVVQPLVLAEKIADFPAADADVARGNIRIRPDILIQLGHEALAEAHHLGVGFPLRVKIAAALRAADGKPRQAVFEDLLEAEEFDDPLINRGVKTQAALVGADGVVELHTEAAVDMDTSLIVRPRDPELDHAVGLHQTVQHTCFQTRSDVPARPASSEEKTSRTA